MKLTFHFIGIHPLVKQMLCPKAVLDMYTLFAIANKVHIISCLIKLFNSMQELINILLFKTCKSV